MEKSTVEAVMWIRIRIMGYLLDPDSGDKKAENLPKKSWKLTLKIKIILSKFKIYFFNFSTVKVSKNNVKNLTFSM